MQAEFRNVIKIGVIGYSTKSFPIYEAYNKIVSALEKVIDLSAHYSIYSNGIWQKTSEEEYRKHGIVKIITYLWRCYHTKVIGR